MRAWRIEVVDAAGAVRCTHPLAAQAELVLHTGCVDVDRTTQRCGACGALLTNVRADDRTEVN